MEGEDEREREVKAGRVRKEWEQGEKEKRGEKKLEVENKITYSQSTDLSKLIYRGTNF